MVTFPKECKGCHLEYNYPHSGCDGCEKGSKYKPLMKSHREQINEILAHYLCLRQQATTQEQYIQLLKDEIIAIEECVNTEG